MLMYIFLWQNCHVIKKNDNLCLVALSAHVYDKVYWQTREEKFGNTGTLSTSALEQVDHHLQLEIWTPWWRPRPFASAPMLPNPMRFPLVCFTTLSRLFVVLLRVTVLPCRKRVPDWWHQLVFYLFPRVLLQFCLHRPGFRKPPLQLWMNYKKT